MGYCVNCGSKIEDGAKFCTNCGAPQQPHMQVPAAQAQEPFYENAGHQAYDSGNSYEETSAGTDFGSDFGTSGAYGSEETSTSSYGESGTGSTYSSSAGSAYSTGSAYSSTSTAGGTSGEGYGAGAYGIADTSNPVPGPGFTEAVKTCLSKFATFSGRARRSEYWYFVLFIFVANLVVGFIGNIIFGTPPQGQVNMLQRIFSAVIFIPHMAVTWRRLHDIGKSGLWFLLTLLPVIGWIILLVFEARDSEPGENRFGMSPKYPGR